MRDFFEESRCSCRSVMSGEGEAGRSRLEVALKRVLRRPDFC